MSNFDFDRSKVRFLAKLCASLNLAAFKVCKADLIGARIFGAVSKKPFKEQKNYYPMHTEIKEGYLGRYKPYQIKVCEIGTIHYYAILGTVE